MSELCTFMDGPAAGKTSLVLKRAPVLLRVVINKAGKLDALDQPSDVPAADEKIYVYRMATYTECHIHICKRGGGGGLVNAMVEYRLHDNQPPESVLVSGMDWADWVRNELASERSATLPTGGMLSTDVVVD